MSDPNKSDSDRVTPRPASDTAEQNGVPAWLDGSDVPDATAPRPDSWPELIPLTTPANPAGAVPSRPAGGPKWSEPDSWPEVPPPGSEKVDHPDPDPTGDPPPPTADHPVAPTGDPAVHRQPEAQEVRVPPAGPFTVMGGVTVLRDDFAGVNWAGPGNTTPDPPAAPKAGTSTAVESAPVVTAGRDLSVTYGVTVGNTSPGPLHQVRVEHDLAPGPRFLTADPAPDVRGTTLVWNLGTLDPGSNREIHVTVQPNFPGEIAADAVALFRVFQCVHCQTRVHNPAAPPDRPPSGPSERDQYLVFTVAGADFAVPVRGVVEVGRPVAATPRPNLPEWVLGMAGVRGQDVVLVDLGRCLGAPLPDAAPHARMVLVAAGDTTAGLVADRVAGVRSLALPADGPPAPVAPDRLRRFVRGVADDNGRPLFLLDVDRLLHGPDLQVKPG